MKDGITLTLSIKGDAFGGDWKGEGIGVDFVGFVVEEGMRIFVPGYRFQT
jgi:hypothetical protein